MNLRAVGFWPSVFGLVVFIAVTSNCVSGNMLWLSLEDSHLYFIST